MRPTQVRELIALEGFEALEAAADGRPRAKLTIIKAGLGKNRRNYRAAALESAVKAGLYNGVRMFVDHSDKPPMKRSLSEMTSAIESAEWNPTTQAVEGTVVFFKPEFAELARNAQGYMGASVNNLIRATRTPQSDGTVQEDVQSIERVHSVDWVIYPAAGGELQQFLESEEGDMIDWTKITAEDIKANAPAVAAALAAKESKDPDPKDDDDEDLEVKITRAVATALEARESAETAARTARESMMATVKDHVGKSGLPEPIRARLIRTFETSDPSKFTEASVTESIEDSKKELKALGVRGPQITGMGATSTTSGGEGSPSISTGSEVRESVEAIFGKKPAGTTTAQEGANA